MIEVEALQFTDTFKTYDSFRSEEKNILLDKYSALLDTATSDDFETIYKNAYDYVMQTIYNYYDCYYLTSPTKDRFLTLLGTILSGKLPVYKVMYDNYLNARKLTYDSLGGRSTTSSGSDSVNSSGEQTYANTPENINPDIDYIDEYSTSKSKYGGKRSSSRQKTYNESLTGGAKQVWENVKSIPDDIYKEVITIVAKLFFSESMEERSYPCAYLTLTRKVQELDNTIITSLGQQLNTDYELVTTLTTEGNAFKTSTDFKHAILKELKTTYDSELHAVQTKWIYRDGFEGVDTYTIPMSSLTTSGLMSSEQFSKLDQVVLYGTNYASSGENYAVRKDEDNDLYVVVPKGEVGIASKDSTGVVQLYENQLTTAVETTLYDSGVNIPIRMDSRNKLFATIPETKCDNLTTKLNDKKEIEVITDGETIQAGANGLETKIDNETIKIGNNGIYATLPIDLTNVIDSDSISYDVPKSTSSSTPVTITLTTKETGYLFFTGSYEQSIISFTINGVDLGIKYVSSSNDIGVTRRIEYAWCNGLYFPKGTILQFVVYNSNSQNDKTCTMSYKVYGIANVSQ